MLLVKTYLDKSPIHGIGVFASKFIKKGTLVWNFNPVVDIVLSRKQFNELPNIARNFVDDMAFSYPFGKDTYCMSIDHAQYMNHSDSFNLGKCDRGDITLKDIPKGTELTVNYYDEDHRTNDTDFSKNG